MEGNQNDGLREAASSLSLVRAFRRGPYYMCESLRFVELGEDGGKKTRATVWILRERTA